MASVPSKKSDLAHLAELAPIIDAGKSAIETRRRIFVRRREAGDTNLSELAEASGTTTVNVRQALRVAEGKRSPNNKG